jgi:CheY-like chemotaxis protein/two-component sensor histidine kinase
LAVLSHELRTPLNPILGWSKLLQNGKLDAAKTAQALNTIERNAKLQAKLIEDLLDVSRILRGKFSLNVSPIHLASTIRGAIETVRLAAEAKSIAIEAHLDSEVGQVAGDSIRLQQVVWNLLSNAVKFTPADGYVEVRLEQVDHQAQITVSDNGKGIPESFLPYVFDYFRQEDGATTRQFGGLGLGLAIVRHLVELHGGTVAVTSASEGLGATFTVKLPLLKRHGDGKMEEWEEHHSLINSSTFPLMGLQILVIDDETDSREFVAFALEQAGASVTAVPSALTALESLTQLEFDAVVSDIGMPEMDGYALIRQIRQQGNSIHAIALTAYAGEEDQQQALHSGFQQHLAKPVEPDELVRSVAQLSSCVEIVRIEYSNLVPFSSIRDVGK